MLLVTFIAICIACSVVQTASLAHELFNGRDRPAECTQLPREPAWAAILKAEDLEPMLDDYFEKFGDIDPTPSHWRRYLQAQVVGRGHAGLSYLTKERAVLLFEMRVQKIFAAEGIALAKGQHADLLPLGAMPVIGDRKRGEIPQIGANQSQLIPNAACRAPDVTNNETNHRDKTQFRYC